MAAKRAKLSKATVFVGLTLVGLLFLLVPQNITAHLNFAFVNVFGFMLNIGSSAPINRLPQENSPLFVPRHEYNRLQSAYANLQAKMVEQKKQIELLSKIRMTEPEEAVGLVIAKVINRKKHELIIDKGVAGGIAKGQFVLGDNAVIGMIEQVSGDIANVRLMTSSSCKMAVKISAPDADVYYNGTMAGDDKEAAKILLMPKKYDIKTGYNVYAAPVDGFLPSLRLVGWIKDCRTDRANPVQWDITVEPSCKFENITDVAVIVLKGL